MDDILMIFLIGVVIISLVPVINLNKAYTDKKYYCLKYLINVAFFWTVLILIELLVNNIGIIYYAHMLSFPVKFVLASLMVCTIFNYIEKPIPTYFIILFFVFLTLEIGLALSNSFTGLLVDASVQDVSSLYDIVNAKRGILFIYHLILSFSILLFSVGYLLYFLRKYKGVRQYKQITQAMVISIVLVLSLNLLQLLVIDTTIDLTYVSLVIAVFLLYRVIYKRDMVFNLKTSGRGEILSNMREMYILTDRDKNIVEISNLLTKKYNVEEDNYIGKPLDDLIDYLTDNIIFYSEYNIDQDQDAQKDHFHLREKRFKLKGMDDYGYMILLYDETKVFNLLRELNRLSNYDSMTNLHNRNYIERQLDELDQQENLGIISLDLNGLKVNNDYLGHERGDYLLKTLAKKIKEVMKDYAKNHIARIGGDEFLIILENTSPKEPEKIKKRILDLCEHPEIDKVVSVSIGTTFSKEKEDIFELIQQADKKMYEMKRSQSDKYKRKIVEFAKKSDKYIR
ncbi:MAG: diguanylate cyclase [Candidatus Izimaplasma sp.]|nr:diguanylate cyclase [Candidatus Izimaplasma bacterium]